MNDFDIGTPVWYYPDPGAVHAVRNSSVPFAAVIVWIFDGDDVSLAGFDHGGVPFRVSHVRRAPADDVGRWRLPSEER
jgi:hypothetical protein